jgi:hypothetical protein
LLAHDRRYLAIVEASRCTSLDVPSHAPVVLAGEFTSAVA